MTRKKTPKPVRIATIQDLVDVATPKNFELLMKDLALVVHSYVLIKAAGMKVSGAEMEWTDDGNNELTGFHIKFIPPQP